MRRRAFWPFALLAGFALVAATAGTAGAKPPPPVPAEVGLEMSADCVYDQGTGLFEAITMEATALALNPSTQVDHISISLREFHAITESEARGLGYFPYATMLDIADWHTWEDTGGVPSVTLAMATSDTDFADTWDTGTKHHFHNTMFEPLDEASWYEAQAWTHASSQPRKGKRGGTWADEQARSFIRCLPAEVFVPTAWPWDDWNYPDEP